MWQPFFFGAIPTYGVLLLRHQEYTCQKRPNDNFTNNYKYNPKTMVHSLLTMIQKHIPDSLRHTNIVIIVSGLDGATRARLIVR